MNGTIRDILVPAAFGPLELDVPVTTQARDMAGDHGQLRQWTGSGRPLLSLVVARRESSALLDTDGLSGHLLWEVRRLAGVTDLAEATPPTTPLDVEVPGALAVAVTSRFRRDGVPTANALLVLAVGVDQYVVHVMCMDDADGAAVAEELARRVRVR